MSLTQKSSIQALRAETELLRAQVEKLQQRLQTQQSAALEPEAVETDEWNVWPYTWAQSGWETTEIFCRERFHSFHGKLSQWRLARHNHKLRVEFTGSAQAVSLELI